MPLSFSASEHAKCLSFTVTSCKPFGGLSSQILMFKQEFYRNKHVTKKIGMENFARNENIVIAKDAHLLCSNCNEVLDCGARSLPFSQPKE